MSLWFNEKINWWKIEREKVEKRREREEILLNENKSTSITIRRNENKYIIRVPDVWVMMFD